MIDKIITILISAPSGAWVGLLGALIGSLIAIFGMWLTNRSNIKQLKIRLDHENRIKNEDILKERLEELYILTENWLKSLLSNCLSLMMVMRGKIDYNQHLDIFIESDNKIKYDFSRIEMIIHIYVPGLKDSYEKVIASRGELVNIQNEHKIAYKKGDIGGEIFLKPYISAQHKLEKAGEEFKKRIAEHARDA